jgi:hypothetical protein
MKYFILLLIGIIVILGIYIWTLPETPDESIKQHYENIKLKEHHIDTLNKLQTHFKEKLKEDSVKSIVREKAYIKRITTLEKKIKEVRTVVQPKIDSSKDLQEYVALRDSSDRIKDAEIDTLKKEKVDQWNSFNGLVKVEQDKFNDSQDINKNLKSMLEKSEKQNKKLRIGNKILKVVAGAAVIGGAYLAASH